MRECTYLDNPNNPLHNEYMVKMRPEKAAKILTDFKRNNFAVGKTLKENGYTDMTADKKGGEVIARATKTIAQQIANASLDEIRNNTVIRRNIDILGLTADEVASELRDIATQKRDYSTKLKILTALAPDIGVNLTIEEDKTQPLLNITVENTTQHDNDTRQVSSKIVESE